MFYHVSNDNSDNGLQNIPNYLTYLNKIKFMLNAVNRLFNHLKVLKVGNTVIRIKNLCFFI